MPNRRAVPIALTIAGSDSGGGAGIQADLKTFAALGVHGTSVITVLTAQNPKVVLGVEAASTAMIRQQIEAVFAELTPNAIKTGMLFSAAIIEAVVASLAGQKSPLIVDPVMVSTSGARLLKENAVRALAQKLLPLCTLVTPNLDEAEILTGRTLKAPEDLRTAAREICEKFGCAVLVKGGHLSGTTAIDIFFDGRNELLLEAPRTRNVSTHGTGCTYSAAITAELALGRSVIDAVQNAKSFITGAIANSVQAGRHSVLNTSWNLAEKSRSRLRR